MEITTWRAVAVCVLTVSTLWASGCGDSGGDACNASNCGGCCLLGQCVAPSGQNGAACGLGGAACSPCGADGICDPSKGGCVSDSAILPPPEGNAPCGPTCSGCCNRDTDKCVDIKDQNDNYCGQSNRDCKRCAQFDTCEFGSCRWQETNTISDCDPSVECFSSQNNRCELGLTRQNCGMGGQCLQCGTGQWCVDGACKAGDPAMEACLTTCAGTGCCNKDGRCIKFISNQDELLESLLGGTNLSNTQSDVACGMESCIKCPVGYRCDAQVGACTDERYLRDFRICVERVVVADPASTAGKYDTDGLWGDLWEDETPEINVKVRVGGQSGATPTKQGRVETISTQVTATEYVSQRCSFWQRLWNGQCEQDAIDSYRTYVTQGTSIHGYAVSYSNACPLRINEDALRGSQIEFDIEEVDFLLGATIGHCTGEIVGWSTLEADCDRSSLARCQQSCLDQYASNQSLRDQCLGNCYWQYEACLYDDGLVNTLLIRTQCDKEYVLHLEAKAVLVRPGSYL